MSRGITRSVVAAVVAAVLVVAPPMPAQEIWIVPDAFQISTASSSSAWSDSANVVAVVAAFRAALARGDSAGVLAQLAPDVVILEAGGVETLAAYRSHHLPADIAYARAIPGTHTLERVVVRGDAAWVVSTSVAEGRLNDRAINSVGAELIVLARQTTGAPWLIRAVHWSSRRRTP